MILVTTIVALMIAAGVYLTQVLDPNSFRGDIETLARDQGVPLSLKGPVAWQWYPRLGLRLENVAIADESQSLLAAQVLAAQVAVAPLLQGQVVVAGIELTGVDLTLAVDKQGRSNWQAITEKQSRGEGQTSSSVASTAGASASTSPLNLAVQQLQLTDVSVAYRDEAAGMTARVAVPTCLMTGFNLDGKLFELACQTRLNWQAYQQIDVETRGQLGFDQNNQTLLIDGLAQTLSVGAETLTLRSSGSLDIKRQQLNSQFEVQPFNPKAWMQALAMELPDMAEPGALTKLSVSGQLSSSDSQWQLQNLSLTLDNSHFEGSLSQSAEQTLAVLLQGDQLNLDHYLPPPAKNDTPAGNGTAPKSAQRSSKTAPASEPADRRLSNEPLPLEAIKPLSMNLALGLKQFQAAAVQMQKVQLEAMAHKGLVDLNAFSAALYQGSVKAQGRLDTRPKTPSLSVSSEIEGVQLQPLLAALAEEQRMVGQAAVSLNINARGNSLGAWQRSAQGQVQVQAETLAVNELDIEKSFCEMAALVSGKPAPQLDWKGKTDLQQVLVKLQLQGTEAKFTQLQAGVEELQVAATGTSDYLQGDFDIKGDLRVTGAANPDRVCQIRDRWRNRDLPLRCKGNIDQPLSGRVCGPDKARFNKLLEDEAKGRLQEKLQEKIQEKLKGSNAEQVETLLRGLFGR
jgi:AsmA protein